MARNSFSARDQWTTGHDLTVCSVLSGNGNFEGCIHAECRTNLLTSPPLVIAYALAGTMHADLIHRSRADRHPGRGRLLPPRRDPALHPSPADPC